MILLEKTYLQIMEETLAELEGMGITNKSPGSVARLFLSIINKRLATYYEALTLNHAQAFVSKAKGNFLDLIGELVNCKRLEEERNDDEVYRYRITKQIQIVASANETAIRLAALSVHGVQDVKMKRFTHGTGSYSVYVVTEDPVTPTSILESVQNKIDEVQAYGVRGEVYRPDVLRVEMHIRLIFNKVVTVLERKLAIAQAQDALTNHINSRNVGEPLVIDHIDAMLKKIHDRIEEVIIYNYKINGRPMLVVDQECAWNERFIESEKSNALYVS